MTTRIKNIILLFLPGKCFYLSHVNGSYKKQRQYLEKRIIIIHTHWTWHTTAEMDRISKMCTLITSDLFVAVENILRLVNCERMLLKNFIWTFLDISRKTFTNVNFFSQINVKVWRIWKQFKHFTYWKNAPKAWGKLPKCSCDGWNISLRGIFLVFMPCILIICYNILLFGGMVFCTRLPLYTQRKSEYIIKKYFMENRR